MIDTRNRFHRFDGGAVHYTKPNPKGVRRTLIYFTVADSGKMKTSLLKQFVNAGFSKPTNKWVKEAICNQKISRAVETKVAKLRR